MMKDSEMSTVLVVYSEQENRFGSLFGGFIAQNAYELAYLTAFAFNGEVPECAGFDEMIFREAVNIGDLVRFTARVVHTHGRVMRILVTVQVQNPRDLEQQSQTNSLMFVFLQPHLRVLEILPDSYDEVLMYLDARRWQIERGPGEILVLGKSVGPESDRVNKEQFVSKL